MVALVMSGGGPVAVAWEAGLLAGLGREGVSFSNAEFVLGTSAGAIVGAQLCCGVDPGAIAEAILAEARGIPPPGSRPPPFDGEAAARLPALFAKARDATSDPAVARAEIGAEALAAPTESEEANIGRFGAIVGETWPDRPLGCVVVDSADGRIEVLTRSCGAPLSAAVAASCCLPGLNAPVTINGRRYIDGGFASAANADLAGGFTKVLILAFHRQGPSGPSVAASAERQATQLRRNGAEVQVIHPDEACLDLIGDNGMNMRARPTVAEAAITQGVVTAADVALFVGSDAI
jgi:NTE family protein